MLLKLPDPCRLCKGGPGSAHHHTVRCGVVRRLPWCMWQHRCTGATEQLEPGEGGTAACAASAAEDPDGCMSSATAVLQNVLRSMIAQADRVLPAGQVDESDRGGAAAADALGASAPTDMRLSELRAQGWSQEWHGTTWPANAYIVWPGQTVVSKGGPAEAAAEVAMRVAAASDQTWDHKPVRRMTRASAVLQVLVPVPQCSSGWWPYLRLPDMALRPSESDSMMAMARLISSCKTLLGQRQLCGVGQQLVTPAPQCTSCTVARGSTSTVVVACSSARLAIMTSNPSG